MTRTYRRASGACLLGILLVILILALLITILVPTLRRARTLARIAACQANLATIGQGLGMYSDLSDGREPFPLLTRCGNPNALLNADTCDKSVWSPALGSNAMQNVWLLLKQGLLGSPQAFHCWGDESWNKFPPQTPTVVRYGQLRSEYPRYSGWTDLTEFSYGMQFPYDADEVGTVNAAPPAVGRTEKKSASQPATQARLPSRPGLVIFADRNPGGSIGDGRNPSNHSRDGQNVLRVDGSVTCYNRVTNSKAGIEGDDIYVNARGIPGGIPVDSPGTTSGIDTSICPVPSRP